MANGDVTCNISRLFLVTTEMFEYCDLYRNKKKSDCQIGTNCWSCLRDSVDGHD